MGKILRYLRHYKKEAVLGPLFKMLEALFELFIPLVVADIVNVGILGGGGKIYILQRCGLMALLGLVGLLASVTAQYFSAKAAVGMACELRLALFEKIGRLSYHETDRFGTATLLSRTTSDVNQIQSAVNLVLRLFLRSPFIVFGAMIMAFTVSKEAAMTFVVTIPLLSVIVFGIMIASIPLYRRVQAKLDRVLSLSRENLKGARVVRAFVREKQSVSEFSAATGELNRFQRFSGTISALLNPLTYVAINLSVLAIVYLGAQQVDAGSLATGDVIALYNYMGQILVELIKLANFIILITKACACGSRINRIFDAPDGLPVAENPKTAANGSVEFKKVSLTYNAGAEQTLTEISLAAAPGEVIGIIGGTGSGKTSLVNLIPRFYDVTDGQVLVGGVDVREQDVTALRDRIAIVPQKAELFAGTVRENLLWGNQNAPERVLFEALEAARAKDFVLSKEGGLDTKVEQGGKNFSGGQRQRLTVARALVRKPEILILDDSASALDYATDAEMRQAIAALPYHPTVFIVSQRTASIQHADKILVLDDGNAVGLGRHDELLEHCAVYREIFDSQFKGEEVSV